MYGIMWFINRSQQYPADRNSPSWINDAHLATARALVNLRIIDAWFVEGIPNLGESDAADF